MSLEKQLINEGFKAYGPRAFSELPKIFEHLNLGDGSLDEVRCLRGTRARPDLTGDYQNLWMVYVKKTKETPVPK